MHPELDAARAGVVVVLLVLHADVAEQAAEQRAVDRAVRLGLLQVGARHASSPVPPPTAGAARGCRATRACARRTGNSRGSACATSAPCPNAFHSLRIAEEIRALVGEFRVALVGRGGLVQRPLARILHRQRRGDHQHLLQAAFRARRDQHAADARIERQARELAPGIGERIVFVHRAQLVQQRVAVGDRARAGRIEEREILDLAQVQAERAQDHRGERGAQHLRVGERRPRVEILLRIQAHADAVGDAAAAPGALLRRRLRDVLHAQHLDLVAVAVALDARQPRVHHVADARHRERGLGDVGREHHAPRAARVEHAVLLGVRQARVQRQDLRREAVLAAAPRPPRGSRARRAGTPARRPAPSRQTSATASASACSSSSRVVSSLSPLDRAVAHLHRVEPARDLDHRRAVEMLRELLRVDGGGGDDELQVLSSSRADFFR